MIYNSILGWACPPQNVENVEKRRINTMKKNTTIRQCDIVTNLKDENGNILFNLDKLDSILAQKTTTCVTHYCYIIHDKDVYAEDDENKNPLHKAGTLKAPHIHLLLKFNSPQHFENIAKWFNIPANFVGKLHFGWKSAVVYQLHRNVPTKHQYELEELTANFDVQTILDNYDKGNYLDTILEKILNGTIREYNKTLEIDNLALVHHARPINEAFKIRSEYLQATCQDRQMECIFIEGPSGSGKTTLAKKIAKARGLAYFVSSGSNDCLDGFMQQPCILLDDLRPSVLGLSDLLKLLDPNTVSSITSRYKNKIIFCDLIIITSVLDIDTFYRNVFAETKEPITQLKRRCKTYIHMDKKKLSISVWDDKIMQYTKPLQYKNTILEKFIPTKELSEMDIHKKIETQLPFLEPENYSFPEAENSTRDNNSRNSASNLEVISDDEFHKLFVLEEIKNQSNH